MLIHFTNSVLVLQAVDRLVQEDISGTHEYFILLQLGSAG